MSVTPVPDIQYYRRANMVFAPKGRCSYDGCTPSTRLCDLRGGEYRPVVFVPALLPCATVPNCTETARRYTICPRQIFKPYHWTGLLCKDRVDLLFAQFSRLASKVQSRVLRLRNPAEVIRGIVVRVPILVMADVFRCWRGTVKHMRDKAVKREAHFLVTPWRAPRGAFATLKEHVAILVDVERDAVVRHSHNIHALSTYRHVC
jgi:hypothetical protein